MTWNAWAILGLALLAGGCAREASGSGGLTAVADTVDGTPVLTYPGEGGIPLAWSADTLARIGDVMGDDDAYQFDRVTALGLAGDADGDVFVLDGAGRRVLSWDAEGRHRATYGRPGEGPGELRRPFALALGAGDTVWVLDPANERVTGYPKLEGEPRVVTLRNLDGFPQGGFAVRNGAFLLQTTAPLRMGGRGGRASFNFGGPGRRTGPPPASSGRAAPPAAAEEDQPDAKIPVFRVSMEGVPGDTLWQSTPPPMNMVQVGGGGSGAVRNVMVLAMAPQFEPTLRWAAFSDGGLAVAETDDYRISLVDPGGHVRLVLRRDVAPWPVGDAEKEFAREKVRNSNLPRIDGAAVDMGPIIEQQLANMTFAATVPRITKIRIDRDDRIWVGVAIDKPEQTGRVDVYDRDGRFLGSIPGLDVPDAFFADGRAASIVKDPDTDVQQIAVLRFGEG